MKVTSSIDKLQADINEFYANFLLRMKQQKSNEDFLFAFYFSTKMKSKLAFEKLEEKTN